MGTDVSKTCAPSTNEREEERGGEGERGTETENGLLSFLVVVFLSTVAGRRRLRDEQGERNKERGREREKQRKEEGKRDWARESG